MFEVAAVLIYGVLSIVAALVTASIAGSPIGAAVAFASAGVTYLFQIAQLLDPKNDSVPVGMFNGLMVLAIILSPLSVLISLLEAYHVF